MSNWFNQKVKVPNVRHSVFDMSNDYKTSMRFGELIPDYVEDCVPSDKFLKLSADIFLRLAPMKYPIMHRIKVRQHYFQVPYRLIIGDENYEKFLNNQLDLPSITLKFSEGHPVDLKNTIIDYLGYTDNVLELDPAESGIDMFYIPNPVAILAYLLIWKNWFADEVLDADASGLIPKVDTVLDLYRSACDSGVSNIDIYTNTVYFDALQVKPISYSKDYFTSAQINTQRGDSVSLSVNPYIDFLPGSTATGSSVYARANPNFLFAADSSTTPASNPHILADFSILDLWKAEQLQRFLEVDNVFGTRVFEKLAGHWGVISSDARIQKPRFISGSQSYVQIQEVIQTSASSSGSALGSQAGKGIMFNRTKSVRNFCEEHSFVIGLLSVVPDNGYMTGNPRYFFKQNIFDFASPEFNNIGYQSIYKGEIYASGVRATDFEEFGYQPRYSEYRSHPSIATGDFRSNPLLAWHLNRSFSSLPPLNANFVHVNNTDANRIFNDTSDTPKIYVDVWTNSVMSRPVSYLPNPMHLY